MFEYQFVGSIKEIDESAYKKLLEKSQNTSPFMKYGFFLNLELSQCLGEEQGWIAYYLAGYEQGVLKLFVPLYLKTHSYGEFVFDFTWAQAYERNGLQYYPKLVNAIPFTPAMGEKQLIDKSVEQEAVQIELKQVLMQFCNENQFSSCHVLFDTQSKVLSDEYFMLRQDVHFIWYNQKQSTNQKYSSFDDLLSEFKSRKRKNVNKERKALKEQGFTFQIKEADEIEGSDIEVFYQFYQRQHAKYSRYRSNSGYLNKPFFEQLLKFQPESLVMVCAQMKGDTVGVALSFKGDDTLYGRYWGCSDEYEFLHFETCYYQGIDYCIKNGLNVFDPGVQGEHKLNRGFVPHKTYSTHFIAHPEFKNAISSFLDEEKAHSDLYFQEKLEQVVYKSID